MIAWWWVLVVFAVQVAVAAALREDVREALGIILAGVVGIIVGPVTWLVVKADIGAMRLSAEALSRFARARTKNNKPAYVFWTRDRGVIFLRKWRPGDPVPKVDLAPQWRGPRVRDEA